MQEYSDLICFAANYDLLIHTVEEMTPEGIAKAHIYRAACIARALAVSGKPLHEVLEDVRGLAEAYTIELQA